MASPSTNVVILGFGEIGSAIHNILQKNTRISLSAWDKNAHKLPEQVPLETLIPSADIVLVCVPTWILANALQSVKNLLKPECIIVTVAKGFEKESCRTLPEILAQTMPSTPHVHLAGPMLAEELHAGKSAIAVVASTNAKARRKVAALFRSTALKVTPSTDMIGVSMAGALKNVYAIGMGALEELELGANARGWYLVRAIEEMRVITEAFGGKAKSVMGMAGLGDLVATGTSPYSGNFTVGRELARGEAPSRPSEGLNVLPCLLRRLPEYSPKLPILNSIALLVERRTPPRDCLSAAFIK